MTPDYQIIVDQKDITERLRADLLSLNIDDQAGFESDSMTMEIADKHSNISIPPQGAKIAVSLGFKETGLVFLGNYVVDAIDYTIVPNKLTIKAKAADLYNSANEKSRKTRAWDKTSLGKIVTDVAASMGLKAAVSGDLSSILIPHLDQTDESNLHFLTRIAKKYGATAKPAGGKLVFAKTGAGVSASGNALPTIILSLSDIKPNARYSQAGRNKYDGVEAAWRDPADHSHKKTSRSAKKSKKKKSRNHTETEGGENRKKLHGVYANKADADAAAKAEMNRLERESNTLELELKHGDPTVRAEMLIKTDETFNKPELIGDWIVKKCSHNLNRSGYTTSMSLVEKG